MQANDVLLRALTGPSPRLAFDLEPAAAVPMALQMVVRLAQLLADAGYRLRSDAGRRPAYPAAAGMACGATGSIH